VRVISTSMHGLEMPVGECPCIARGACPSCARGPPGVLFTALLHMYGKSVVQTLYSTVVGT